jgi:hypothetical protein
MVWLAERGHEPAANIGRQNLYAAIQSAATWQERARDEGRMGNHAAF